MPAPSPTDPVAGPGAPAPSRISATYRVAPARADDLAEAIRVEQTIEFPIDLAPAWIAADVVGRVERVDNGLITITYDQAVATGGLTQLLNVIWGNVSLFEGVRLVEVHLPPGLGTPARFGIPGLRTLFAAADRALLATALKPMGMTPAELARTAAMLAAAGIDLIKDDHSLADQPWAPWRDRVAACAAAVAEVNSRLGTRAIYAPCLNSPADRMVEDAHLARSLGAGALLVMPGVTGFDAMRVLAADDTLNLPLLAHPSFLGSHTVSPGQGIRHGLLFGLFMRMAGADISIFPNHGGRFTFTESQCLDIRDCCLTEWAGLPAIWPAPGGGMTLDRLDDLLNGYGRDVVLLIGGALHRGDLAVNAAALADRVRAHARC